MNGRAVPNPQSIVVGVDGSHPSDLAISWACATATVSKSAVNLVYVELQDLAPAVGSAKATLQRDHATDVLDHAAHRARTSAPVVKVLSHLAFGTVGTALCKEAALAEMLVVGRSTRSVARFFLGSVARDVLHHASVPVVVIPDDYEVQPIRKILVGIDGSAGSVAALDWAITYASQSLAIVDVLHTWLYPYTGRFGAVVVPFDVKADAQALLDEVLAAARLRHGASQITLRGQLRQGGVTGNLIAEADHSQLVVVGSRGLGGFQGLRLGSVAQYVAEHSPCPVVVVRAVDIAE